VTALVTGATGFVGTAVTRALLARGKQVRVLSRPQSDQRNLADLEVEIATGDLTDRASLQRATAGITELYHVAADYRLWVPRPEEMIATNVDGTRDLLRAAGEAGVSRIVYTSSVATLGIAGGGNSADETTPSRLDDMISVYKRSKFLAEEEVRRLVGEEGLPVVIVNPSTPVGPRDIRPTPTGRLIAEAAAGKIPAFVDTGLNVVHVDDVAEGHLLAFDLGAIGERYILGGENLTLREILTEIAALCGRNPPKVQLHPNLVLPIAVVVEAWARLTGSGEPMTTVDAVRMSKKKMFFSSEKAVRELGYKHRPARAAITDAVTWFRENGYCS
jgi:dihydroflavonol-4-reductase